jgi:5-(carboxyamino)imidazole ribonucleotide synthase
MFAQAAARMGYRVHVFSPHVDSATSEVASWQTVADYEDLDAVRQFARSVDVVTIEFENIPAEALAAAIEISPVRPGPAMLHITQHRLREKQFLSKEGIPCTPYAAVESLDALGDALSTIGLPAVLKTIDSGYDGKGQATIHSADEAAEAWASLGGRSSVLEQWVDFRQELSVLVARSLEGETAVLGPIANDHANHILDVSRWPAPELESCAEQTCSLARTIAEKLQLVGICCVEFFLTTDDRLLVNEIAPRTHNSGHLTIEAATTSQFEQQVRAICGLPLGRFAPVCPAAMANLLGDLWETGEPDWQRLLAEPGVVLHLYGKGESHRGRKMGHLTVLAESSAEAARQVLAARRLLAPNSLLHNDLREIAKIVE